jgi:hypothetical protein
VGGVAGPIHASRRFTQASLEKEPDWHAQATRSIKLERKMAFEM